MGYDRSDSFPLGYEPNEIHLVQNRKENCHHDHIPFNMKENGNIVFSVYTDYMQFERKWKLTSLRVIN